MTYVDLFCGAGGFSLGFDRAGLKNIFSLDRESNFCETYKANFPHHNLIQKDIRELSRENIIKLIPTQKVDVVIGGPPCQGFSMAGNIGRRFIEDERNQLFREFARIISIIKPKYFIMENVARLFTHNKGQTQREIIELFNNLESSLK